MLPRRIGLSELGEQKVASHPWGGQDWFRKEDFVYADTHSALAVRLAREERSAMGRAGKNLRCLRVFGQPKDVCISRSSWKLCGDKSIGV